MANLPPGRGRGESTKLAAMEQITSVPRLAVQSGEGASGGQAPTSEVTIRGRGGFKTVELHTIPPNITEVRAKAGPGQQEIQILANFVELRPLPKKLIYQYRVDFEPQVESVDLRKKLFYLATERVFDVAGDQQRQRSRCAFDGTSDARSFFEIPNGKLETTVNNPREAGVQVKVTVKKVGTVTNTFEMLRLYNLHMKTFLKALNFFQVSTTGAYVHPDFRTPIGQNTGIVAVRGYRTSANVHEANRILMNFESVHKLMQQQNVLQHMMQLRNAPNFMEAIKTQLTGKLVVTNYNKYVYRIEDVNFNLNPQSTFEDKRSGQPIAYARYFRDRHNTNINDLQQPLLLAIRNNNRKRDLEGDQDDVYLVPELCNIAGLTDQQRADGRLRMDLVRSSQIDPSQRITHLREFLSKFHDCQEVSGMLDRWGYAYDKDLISIKARILPTECVGLSRSLRAGPEQWPKVDSKTASFDNLIMREVLAVAPACERLKIIIGRSDLQRSDTVLGGIRRGFQKVGLQVGGVEVIRLQDGDNANMFVQALRRLDPDTSAAIVILPSQNKEKYDAIKKCASVEKGLITQVVTSKLMCDERKASGAAVKIGIQMAAKLGGEPWYVNIPVKGVMVCGYDTYHDTTKRGRSYGAFVASTNINFSRWWSKADSHDHLDELSLQMANNLSQALTKFKNSNQGRSPDRLIIYRDGVSDGQLDHVYKVELKQILKVVEDFDKKIRMAFIVVNKRIGARFYWKNGANFINCPPGTVIDDIVTRRERFDFYLISQSTRNGTVAPTYYNIIHDTTGLEAGKHQAMAYKLCFAYYNWSGTVRVPAPCQYAHKLAYLCGEHLHATPQTILDERLHFL